MDDMIECFDCHKPINYEDAEPIDGGNGPAKLVCSACAALRDSRCDSAEEAERYFEEES